MADSEPAPSTTTSVEGPVKMRPLLKMEECTDKACREPAAKTYSDAFSNDPALRWVLTKRSISKSLIDDIPLRDFFFSSGVVPIGLTAGGTVINPDGEWGCVGILVPPGRDTEALSVYLKTIHHLLPVVIKGGFSPTWKAMITYPSHCATLRAAALPRSHLKRHDYFYVFFLGTRYSARGRGLGGAFIRHCQDKATQAKKPIYFECSKDASRVFYEHLGFKTVEMVRIGKGEVDEDGGPVKGGVGVRLWALVWWPEGMWPEGVREWKEGREG